MSLLMITGALVFRSPGESVTTKTPCPTGSSRTLDASPRGRKPEPGLTLLAIGHSIGGHAVLLSSASTDLRAAVMIASHAGVTSTISQTKEKLRVWCLLRVLGPALCRLFGYMPARRLGLGEDLPAPAMLQWGRWSAMPEYFYDDPEWDARQRAGKITLPILVLGFDDDPWANTEAISRLLAPAQNAK